jgi:Na+-driven multidrug efflux pump
MLPRQPEIAALAARCLFVTGFIQSGFAASMIFSGALRGAGDTLAVMGINLFSTIALRLAGVLFVVFVLGWRSLVAVWVVLASELFCRGVMAWVRFEHGGWKHLEV